MTIREHAARVHLLYRSAMAADDAFQAELVATYGANNAQDARYDPSRYRATPMLALLHEAFRASSDALHSATVELHAADSADAEPIPA